MQQANQNPTAQAVAVFKGLTGTPVINICSEYGISAAEYDCWRQELVSRMDTQLANIPSDGHAKVRDLASLFAALANTSEDLAEPLQVAQELIEALPIPVFFKGRDGKYLGVNKAWETFFGVSRQAFLGKDVRALYPQSPSVAEKHDRMDKELWHRPGSQSYEIPVVVRGGALRHTIYYKATFTRSNGEVAGLIGTIIDVTERKLAEQRQTLENRVTLLLVEARTVGEAMPQVIEAMCETLGYVYGARWVVDDTERVMRCSESWCVADAAIDAFRRMSVSRIEIPDKPGGLNRKVWATSSPVWIADIAQETTLSRRHAGLEAGLHSAFAFPILVGGSFYGAAEFYSRNVHGRDERVLEIARTIGNQIGQFIARKEAEAALLKSEARFRSLTELSSDWYWEQDEHFRFTAMSRGIVDNTSVSADDFIGKTWPDIPGIVPPGGNWRTHQMTLDARESFHDVEFACRDAQGRMRHLSSSGRPVTDEHGNFKGYRGVGKDITRRKVAELALRDANDELTRKAQDLARSNAELEQFAYVASHDLQEPLRMVSSYTQLIARRYGDRLDGDAREFMDFIVDGAARMKQLIEDLLSYSRVGKRGESFEPTDCHAALTKALANLRTAIDDSAAVVTHDALPTVDADGRQLMQLFQNLIGNALKFKGSEPPRIHVGAIEDKSGWTFTVADNGIGIDPQYFERIFMVFQRLHNKTEYAGTGIGLAICKKVVDRHGGRIWVESQPAQGSTFYFSFPRRGEQDHE